MQNFWAAACRIVPAVSDFDICHLSIGCVMIGYCYVQSLTILVVHCGVFIGECCCVRCSRALSLVVRAYVRYYSHARNIHLYCFLFEYYFLTFRTQVLFCLLYAALKYFDIWTVPWLM